MKLHTVFITHNRLELTKIAIESYLETVTVEGTFAIVDNYSEDGTGEWMQEFHDRRLQGKHWLNQNYYPGHATNIGWFHAPEDATHLQRADNDFEFLPGWCEQVAERFAKGRKIGQVGLRTAKEDDHSNTNTGGNCVIDRRMWDAGLRYDERPWPQLRAELGDGITEDSLFSPAVKAMGWNWTRVKRPAIRNLASGDWHDPYYVQAYGIRGIRPRRDDPTVPADWTGGYST